MLRMIGGLQRPDSGEVRVAGHSLSSKTERELGEIRRGIGMLFQNGALLDSMTVLENVGLPLREHTKQSLESIRERVSDVLDSVGLHDVEPLLPRELSGGMLRRVAFARAIVMEPHDRFTDGVAVAAPDEVARAAVVNDIADGVGILGDDRYGGGHRPEERHDAGHRA